MKIIKFLLFAIALLSGVSASVATAVTVTLTDQSVGQVATYVWKIEEPYWAGVVTLDIDGVEYLAMSTMPWSYYDEGPLDPDRIGIVFPSTWETELLTRDDITARGGVDSFFGTVTPENISLASELFLNGLLGYNPADPLWTASFNEMVWDTILFEQGGYYMENAKTVYDPDSGVTLMDVYNSMLPTLDPNYDYSSFMKVLSNGLPVGLSPMLVFVAPVPVPPAVWLFGSGLIGLAMVARRRRARCGWIRGDGA